MEDHAADSWSCLEIPGIDLPKAGVVFSTLLLQLLVVFIVTQALHRLFFSHFHMTPIVSQLFAGLILAPHSILIRSKTYARIYKVMFPPESLNTDETLGILSYTLFLFLIAVKMDLSIVSKTGRKAFVIGILDLFVPVALDIGFLQYHHQDFIDIYRIRDEQVLNDFYVNLITLPLTCFHNVAVLLTDMKMVNSELGRLALSSATVGPILSHTIILITNVLLRPHNPFKQWFTPLVLLILSIYVVRPMMKWMTRQMPKGRPVKELFLYSGFLIMLLGPLTMELAGQSVLLGAFIVGATVPDGPPLGAAIVEKLDFLVSGCLIPFFTSISVMTAEFRDLSLKDKITQHHLTLAVVAYFSKILVCLLCGLYNKMEFRDSLALSIILCTKGIVDVGTLTMYAHSMVLSRPMYTLMIIWVTIIATISPICVKYLYQPMRKYAGYQIRDIMHCKYNSEFRILACIMRSDSATSFTRLLNACCPSENNLMAVCALHLVKLVGRAHPDFIDHETRTKLSSKSYSEDIVRAFHRTQSAYKDFLSIRVFTAVAPFDAMHEDTCTLALNKLVSVIIIPFHRRFRPDGTIDSEDTEQRALNISLLRKAPCSVGVLVDRGGFRRLSATSALTRITTRDPDTQMTVGVIYIGGCDDHEALAFAKRVGRDSRVRVAVVVLVGVGQGQVVDALDSAMLRDVRTNEVYGGQFTVTEKAVRDGAETAVFLRSVVGSYDLLVVGRRYKLECAQLAGLDGLSEDTGLGTVGDFLASSDVRSTTSLLVVQQQRQWALE